VKRAARRQNANYIVCFQTKNYPHISDREFCHFVSSVFTYRTIGNNQEEYIALWRWNPTTNQWDQVDL
jgi:hypothetical protein